MSKRNRWAVFISGRGSNLGALLEIPEDMDVALVVSSGPKAEGLSRARRAGIPTLVLGKPIDWSALSEDLRKRQITAIFCAGFMRIIPEGFVQEWCGRILNVHPSLLPHYPGLNSIEKAFEAHGPYGVTVHEVVAEVDSGPIILQRELKPSEPHDMRLEDLEFLYHLNEHFLVRESVVRWQDMQTLR